MVLIEEHDENGVNWGISFEGSNPTADKFLALSSKEEAIRAFELIEGHCEQVKEHDEDGVNWGISFEGNNPTADKFLPLPSKEETMRVLELIKGYCKRKNGSKV